MNHDRSSEHSIFSIGPDGIEAIATGPKEVDIYLPRGHAGLSVYRDDRLVADTAPGRRIVRDRGLRSGWAATYRIETPVPTFISETTFPTVENGAEYDVAVIGATAAGTAAAIASARAGASVVLIEETNRIGGMCSNGVSVTDIRSVEHSGGFFEEFRQEIARYYGSGDGLRYEPRVANAVMKRLVFAEPKITLLRHFCALGIARTPRGWNVDLTDTSSTQHHTIGCRVLIDATVEADIAAAAGVHFRIPREPRTDEEPHAGLIYYDNNTDEILPGSTGEADCRIQSYAYMLTVADYGPAADRTIPEPPGYDPDDYRFSPTWEDSWASLYAELPGGKWEINQHPWGTDLPGINYRYPTADPSLRCHIAELYRNRALGYLYYLQTELGRRSIGLAEDEYPDSNSLPPVLYVREARRMVGLAVMTESDITNGASRRITDSIAVGDYPMDSHAMEAPEDPHVRHRGEGEFWLASHTPPYRVPLGVILPAGVDGLIVPTAVSATHVAYGTLRMEPVRMAMGQAAGVLAALAVMQGIEPREVRYEVLRERLLAQGAVLGLMQQ